MDETLELTDDTVWSRSDEIKGMLKAFEHSGIKARIFRDFLRVVRKAQFCSTLLLSRISSESSLNYSTVGEDVSST